MKNGKVLLGVLAGLAAGAVLGILLAPDKGSNTRKKILDKGEELADDLKVKLDEVLDALSQKIETAKQKAEEFTAKEKTEQTTEA